MLNKHVKFLVIGSGIAGARAALELAQFGEVIVLSKSKTRESNTEYAQGGIAVTLNKGDCTELHYKDTISAGAGICDRKATKVLVQEGPSKVRELVDWGTKFDKIKGHLDFTLEAAHSRKRILHAKGDATGREISQTLIRRLKALSNIHLWAHCCATDLLIGSSGCEGVRFIDTKNGKIQEIRSNRVLLATGGVGAAFQETTNPSIATGDGFALAVKAGAILSDMEFIQFHPTALKLQGKRRFLLTEALRGEGAYLCDAQGNRFMDKYHPLKELAPRDIVSRAIVQETRKTRDVSAFLDLRHFDPKFIEKRFPTVSSLLFQFNLDPGKNLIPVFPAAHYIMGGIVTDLWGRTSIPGLYAAGEVACTGAHGANRLASNSLLDGLVFGARSGQAMNGPLSKWSLKLVGKSHKTHLLENTETRVKKQHLKEILTAKIGILRNREQLKETLSFLGSIRAKKTCNIHETVTENIRLNGLVIATSALFREESRGGHHRLDFPINNDRDWKCHSLISYSETLNQITVTQAKLLQENC